MFWGKRIIERFRGKHIIAKRFHDIHDVSSCPFCGGEPHVVTITEQNRGPNPYRLFYRERFGHEPKMTRLMRRKFYVREVHGEVRCPQCNFFVMSFNILGYIYPTPRGIDIESIHKETAYEAVNHWNEFCLSDAPKNLERLAEDLGVPVGEVLG